MTTCSTCLYFVPGLHAHCRRGPPRPVGPVNSSFAVVNEQWWCGEHRFSLRRWLNKLRRWRNKRGKDAKTQDGRPQEGVAQ